MGKWWTGIKWTDEGIDISLSDEHPLKKTHDQVLDHVFPALNDFPLLFEKEVYNIFGMDSLK